MCPPSPGHHAPGAPIPQLGQPHSRSSTSGCGTSSAPTVPSWLHVGLTRWDIECGTQRTGFERQLAPVRKVGMVALKLALAAGDTPSPSQGSSMCWTTQSSTESCCCCMGRCKLWRPKWALQWMARWMRGWAAWRQLPGPPSEEQVRATLTEVESALAQADKRASYHAIKGMLGEGTDIERTCGLVRMYHQGKSVGSWKAKCRASVSDGLVVEVK